MKYIKTFESFNTENFQTSDLNEGLADMFMGFLNKGAAFFDSMLEWAGEVFDTLLDKITGGIKGFIEKVARYFNVSTGSLRELSFREIFEQLAKNNAIKESESITETHVRDLPDGHWMKTKIQQQSARPHDNSNYARIQRERDMEEHMGDNTKDIGQKILNVLMGIFAFNTVGGIPAMIVAWLTKLVSGFDVMEWALSQEWIRDNEFLKAAFNPGNRGFFVVTLVYSLVACLIIYGIKKADAYLATAGRNYGKF